MPPFNLFWDRLAREGNPAKPFCTSFMRIVIIVMPQQHHPGTMLAANGVTTSIPKSQRAAVQNKAADRQPVPVDFVAAPAEGWSCKCAWDARAIDVSVGFDVLFHHRRSALIYPPWHQWILRTPHFKVSGIFALSMAVMLRIVAPSCHADAQKAVELTKSKAG